MKVVIEIPDEAYELLQTDRVDWLGAKHILNAVANGKRLDEVLDEIRSYIEESAKINQNLNTDRARALYWCLDVIDQYSAKSEDTATKEKSCATCGRLRDDAGRCILFKEGKCVQRYEKWIPSTKEVEIDNEKMDEIERYFFGDDRGEKG